jgi:hypothetical protein
MEWRLDPCFQGSVSKLTPAELPVAGTRSLGFAVVDLTASFESPAVSVTVIDHIAAWSAQTFRP